VTNAENINFFMPPNPLLKLGFVKQPCLVRMTV